MPSTWDSAKGAKVAVSCRLRRRLTCTVSRAGPGLFSGNTLQTKSKLAGVGRIRGYRTT